MSTRSSISRRPSLRPRAFNGNTKMILLRPEDNFQHQIEPTFVAGCTTPSGKNIETLEEFKHLIDDESSSSIVVAEDFSAAPTGASSSLSSAGPTPSGSTTPPPTTMKNRKKDIPIPIITLVKHYERDVPADYELLTSYVRYPQYPQEHDDVRIELDLDQQDLEFLTSHSVYGESGDPRYQLTPRTFNRMLDLLEKASGPIFPSLMSYPEAEILLLNPQKVQLPRPLVSNLALKKRCVHDVYQYWLGRRETQRCVKPKPLLRRFWPQTPLNDTNPHLVFRPREKERYKLRKHRKNDAECYRKMKLLRHDFERVRKLLSLIRRREKCKRLRIDFLDEIRRQTLVELTDCSGRIRKPKIPTEERKRKKKKKSALVSNNTHPHLSSSGGHDHHHHHRTNVKSSLTYPPLAVPSFLERLSSSGSCPTLDLDDEPKKQPIHFPTFPSLIHDQEQQERLIPGPPRYKSRARFSRGGRIVFDRVPHSNASSNVYHMNNHETLEETSSSSVSCTKKATPSTLGSAESYNVSSASWSTLPVETTTTENNNPQVGPFDGALAPLPLYIDARILTNIYQIPDYEDEMVDTSHASSWLRHPSKPPLDPTRPIKYTLHI